MKTMALQTWQDAYGDEHHTLTMMRIRGFTNSMVLMRLELLEAIRQEALRIDGEEEPPTCH